MYNRLILISIGILLLIGGSLFYFSQQQQTQNTAVSPETPAQSSDTPQNNEPSQMETVLAGTTSPYKEFTKGDYDKALQEGKTVFLEFYANWCPICRAQEPKLFEGFNELQSSDVVGFRVNYNDDATDEDEKQLAKDFGVTYQHTHVIVKDGKMVHKSNDDLEKDDFISLIQKAKQ